MCICLYAWNFGVASDCVLRINRWYLMIFPRHAWQNSAHIKRARFCIVCMARIFAACVQTIFWRPFSYAKCISCLLNASTLQVKYTARTSSHARICTILNSNEVKKLIGRVFMHRDRWKSEKETATDRMGGGRIEIPKTNKQMWASPNNRFETRKSVCFRPDRGCHGWARSKSWAYLFSECYLHAQCQR